MRRFIVYGPFRLRLDKRGQIPDDLNDFWEAVDDECEGLSEARGCYIFGIRSSGGSRITPWYVGKTNRQTFSRECFNPHQKAHYYNALLEYERATPMLFLIPKFTGAGAFSRSTWSGDVEFLEEYFIGAALKVNPDLRNKRDTKLYREIELPGFFNFRTTNPGNSARSLKATLKLT